MIGRFTKTPDEKLDYTVHFDRWLETGDTIASAEAEATADTVTIDSVDVSETSVKVWISAGADGDEAKITVTATSNDGRIKQECFNLKVRNC